MATLSRTPSPAGRSSGSDADSVVATPMTPRTKLRSLFASMDSDDSDQENKTPSRGKTGKTATAAPVPALGSGDHHSSDQDSDSDVEVRPRGRFAARMQVVLAAAPPPAAAAEQPAADDVPAAGDARERVKRMLAQQQKQAEAEKQKDATRKIDDVEEDNDEGTPAVAPRRRLMNRGAPRLHETPSPVTPSRGAATRESSVSSAADVFVTPAKSRHPMAAATPGSPDSPGMFMTPTKEGDVPLPTETAGEDRHARFQALVARKREEARVREEADERKRAARAARAAEAAAAAADDDDDDGDDEDQVMRDIADLADDDDDAGVSDITDDEGGRKLTQTLAGRRPGARKASKKALEEMHRETQRMSRGLQLAHEAKTKKKLTKAALFERFNFRPGGAAAADAVDTNANTAAKTPAVPASSSRPTSPSSPQNPSDAVDTPPSSPPPAMARTALDKGKGKAVEAVGEAAAAAAAATQPAPKRHVRVVMPPLPTQAANLVLVDSDGDEALEIVATARNKLDALFDNAPRKREQEPRSLLALRRLAQIRSPGKASATAAAAAATHQKTDGLTLGELEQSLQERARQQARQEREERLAVLRAKGVRIVTEAEREQELAEVEDIVARARQEGEELTRRERAAAKKAKAEARARGDADSGDEADPLAWDDSEDEDDEDDYAPGQAEEEEREIELSGSDEDEDEGDDADEDEEMDGALIDDEAASGDESEDGGKAEAAVEVVAKEGHADDAAADSGDDAAEATPTRAGRGPRLGKRRVAVVLSDDSDDDADGSPATVRTPSMATAQTPLAKARALFAKTPSRLAGAAAAAGAGSDSPQAPTSVLRSATKPFIPGLPVAVGAPAGMGLTQIFAGTLADDSQQPGSGSGSPLPSDFVLPTLGAIPTAATTATSQAMVLDSQPTTQEWLLKMQQRHGDHDDHDDNAATATQSQAVHLHFSQSQAHGLDSLLLADSVDDDPFAAGLMEPSQDAAYTPLKVRFVEQGAAAAADVHATVETVVLGQATPAEAVTTPVAARSRRLVRKVAQVEEEGDDDDEDPVVDNKMAAAPRTKPTSLFDRKKSRARDLVEEQAEESEDEYAGLGGADGEDDDDDRASLASVQDLIDDEGAGPQGGAAAERAALAAFYADRERAQDEKQVEKLFRDVTTGQLRRKRDRDTDAFGLSDDSDGDGGAARRRRAKRRQFARMQQALFADERVSKVAANPRNQAFLRTIEDRGSDDEMDFLFDGGAAGAESSASSAAASADGTPRGLPTVAPAAVAIPDSQPVAAAAATTAEPQPHPRRHRRLSATLDAARKPTSLGEIRASLSHLLGDDDRGAGAGAAAASLSVVAESEFGGSDDDEEGGGDNNDNSAAPARHPRRTAPAAVVVDRISLKRGSSTSSTSSTSSKASSSAAGSVLGRPGPTGVRVPTLLRRATTNSLASNGSSGSGSGSSSNRPDTAAAAAAATAGAFGDPGRIKKNASTRSGIHYFARETERRAAAAASDQRRQAKKVRSAAGRLRAVGGLFGGGSFE